MLNKSIYKLEVKIKFSLNTYSIQVSFWFYSKHLSRFIARQCKRIYINDFPVRSSKIV